MGWGVGYRSEIADRGVEHKEDGVLKGWSRPYGCWACYGQSMWRVGVQVSHMGVPEGNMPPGRQAELWAGECGVLIHDCNERCGPEGRWNSRSICIFNTNSGRQSHQKEFYRMYFK